MTASVISNVAYINDEWRDREEIPGIYSRESRKANTSLREVEIFNCREEQDSHTLEGNGFTLINQQTAFANYRDKEAVLSQYFPEMRELIMSITGAADALPFPFYQVRTNDPEHFFNGYSLYMHCDYSMKGCSSLARTIFKSNDRIGDYPEYEWDYAFYNLWRAVEYPAERDPLVWIDGSTLSLDDIIDYRATKEESKGVAAVPLYNRNQRHCYMPNLTTDEVVILKQLDSRPDRIQVCPHTSFIDPQAQADARPRQSIDVRFMCVFPKGAS